MTEPRSVLSYHLKGGTLISTTELVVIRINLRVFHLEPNIKTIPETKEERGETSPWGSGNSSSVGTFLACQTQSRLFHRPGLHIQSWCVIQPPPSLRTVYTLTKEPHGSQSSAAGLSYSDTTRAEQ